MPLAAPLLISSLTVAMRKQNPTPDIFGTDVGTALETYVRPILNITGGNFVGWINPREQIIAASRMLTVDNTSFASKFGSIIENSFLSIQTRNQIGPMTIPKGMLPSQFIGFFSAVYPSSEVLAVKLGKAIDAFARGCLITSADVTSGGTPITGPIV